MRQILCERSTFTTGLGSSTQYIGFPGTFSGIGTFEVQARAAWMVDGTFSNFYFEIDVAPGSGKSRTITIFKNSSTTGVSVTISDLATSGSTSGSFTVTAGDYLSLEVSSSGTPAGSGGQRYSIQFDSDNTGESGYTQTYGSFPDDTNPRRSGVFWSCYQGSGIEVWNSATAAADFANIVPCDGEITGTAMRINQSPGGGTKAVTVVVYKALAASPSTFVKQDGSGGTVDTRVTCSNTTVNNTATFSLPVAAGDRVYYEAIPENTPNTLGMLLTVGARFLADLDGESIMGGFMRTALLQDDVEYFTPHNIHDATGLTEGTLVLLGNPFASFSLSRFYGHLATAPGSGKSREILIRHNGATPASSLAYTIAGTDQYGSDLTGSYLLSSGDTWELRSTPITGTANSTLSFSMVQSPAANPVVGTSIFGEDGTVAGLSRVHLLNLDGVTRTLSDTDYEGSAVLGGNLTLIEQASAPAPIANAARLYAIDVAGKTGLYVIFGTGAAQQLEIEP
jgi:hypothetical protein